MIIKDNLEKIVGDFKAELLDIDGNILETTEEHNMIMDLGRSSISSILSGLGTTPINKVVFGTLGYNGEPLTPIDPNTLGFIPSRTNLFSEAEIGYYTYVINFVPTTNGGYATVTETNSNAGSTVKITQANNMITYEILLSINAANSSGTVNYTEAAMYCGTNIFAMKTFSAKPKDNSSTIKITWSFTF
jgi:hypothetical protein